MPDLFVAKQEPKKQIKHHSLHKSTHQMPPEDVLKKMPGHTRNPLSSYCYYPHNVEFFNKDEEEKIVLLLRRHPITNLQWIIIAIFMALAPLALDILPILNFLPANYQTVAIMLWYLLTLAFVFEQFLTWFFNVNIVTDERLFDVDFVNLLYREITDANLGNIEDVTVKVGSVLRTVFNYGDVLVQTAGEVPNIEFDAVPHPDQVAKILRDLSVEEEVERIEGRVR